MNGPASMQKADACTCSTKEKKKKPAIDDEEEKKRVGEYRWTIHI